MKPARWTSDDFLGERLLHVDTRSGQIRDRRLRDLDQLLEPDDLVVLNDAATLPASLRGVREDGEACEVRLAEAPVAGEARGVLFGAGDWRTPTEDRPTPAGARIGERLRFTHGLEAVVEEIDPAHPRLLRLRLLPRGDALWTALYAAGVPVQYSHLTRALELWAPQTAYAARPWAVEMPSAGRPLRWELLLALRRRGVRWARLTHAAGLSSTGDLALDAALPFRERYELPAETLEAIAEARRRGGRVIAVGTTVVRALEGCVAERGQLVAGAGETGLRIGPGFNPRVVDGLLTGMHDPAASHFALLHAFASGALLGEAHAHAERAGYLAHEFGDSALFLPGANPFDRRGRLCEQHWMSEATLRERLEGKRFGLVLAAGFFGFYGHAGFYAGLREAGLLPSAYAGSSAGGLVGALAATGMEPAKIIELLLNLKRTDFWDPDPLGAIWHAARGLHGGSGILRGDRFQKLLERHLPLRDIEACPAPLAIVATNLSRGEIATFRKGALAPRIHATCAYPGLFRAVEIDGELFWDGGLVDKAPVLALADVAKEHGLDALVVHYLPSRGRDALGGFFAYAQGLDIGMSIARREHFQLQLQVLEARGLPTYVVVSELTPLSPMKMEKAGIAVEEGRQAALRALDAPPVKFQARG